MSYTLNFSLALGASKTGLADLRAQLVDSAGANSGSAISTGFIEIGTGNYLWSYGSFADGFRGGVKFYSNATPATILVFSAINPEEAENIDAKISTRSTTAQIESQLSGMHGAGSWATATGFSTLTTGDIDARLNAYDAATGTEAAAILAAIAALNNLSSTGAQAAAAAALTAYDAATGADVTALGAVLVAQNPPSVSAGQINMRRAVTFDGTLSGVTIIPSGWTMAIFTVKRHIGQPDSEATLQIRVSNPGVGGDGLQRLNGAVATAGDASLAVNQGAGTVTIHVEDSAMALVQVANYWYDLKFHFGSSDSVATVPARCTVAGAVTELV